MTIEGENFDNGDYIKKLLTIAVDHDDYAAIDIVLSWNRDLIEPVDVDSYIDEILEKTVGTNNTHIYDHIIRKKRKHSHESKRMLLEAILNKNPEMIRKVIDTYDKNEPLIFERAYHAISDAMQELDSETKQYVIDFLQKFKVRGHSMPLAYRWSSTDDKF
jgi:hypothetical protein